MKSRYTIASWTTRVLIPFWLGLAIASVAAHAQSGPSAPQNAGREVTLSEKDAFTRNRQIPEWAGELAPIPLASKRDPVTVRLSETSFYVDKDPAFFVRRATQVNEASALGQIGQTEIAYQANYQRVKLHLLRLHRGTQVVDKLEDAEIRFLRREPELDSGIYGGSVTAAIVINDVRVGDTLEIAYTVAGKNPVFGDRFFEAASWDGQYPILKRRVSLNTPVGRTIRYRVIGATQNNGVEEKTSRSGGRQTVRFEGTDMPPIDFEPFTPRDHQAFRWIQFSEYTSWNEVVQWAQGLFSATASPASLQTALEAARKESNPAQAAAKALEFVQKDIRYLSVSLGENSHRPYAPEVVLARRYGDCKDKSLLLVEMLRQLGIEAAPTLVSTSQRKGLEGMLPSPQLFDHAIVRAIIQGKTYFLDPTRLGQAGPLSSMGQPHVDVQALVIAPSVTQLVSIPTVEADTTVTNSRTERVSLSKMDEPALMTVLIQYRGVGAEAMRAGLLQVSSTQLRKFYEGNIGKRYPDAVLLGDPVVTDSSDENRISVELQFRIREFLQAGQGRWTFRHQPDNFRDLFFVPGNANRTTPLFVPGYPSKNRYELEVTLPQEFDAQYLPSQRKLENEAFSYSENLSFKGRSIGLTQDLQVRADRIAAKDVTAFLTDVKKVDEMMTGTLVVKQTDMRVVPQPAAAAVPFKQLVVERLEQVVKSSTQMIADAKSSKRDVGPALCERAKAAAYLGHTADALEDVQSAVRQQPGDPDTLRCRAEVEFATGDFKASDQDFSRAMALGATDVEIYLQRGVAAFYRGNFAVANGDFSKALTQAKQPSERLRAGIWRALAVRRSGEALADDMMSVSQGDSEWQATVLQVLGNRSSAETLLRLAHKESGTRLDTALTEAYFYLGQYYLADQDRTRARAYFRQAVDKGVLYSLFYSASRHELAHLN